MAKKLSKQPATFGRVSSKAGGASANTESPVGNIIDYYTGDIVVAYQHYDPATKNWDKEIEIGCLRDWSGVSVMTNSIDTTCYNAKMRSRMPGMMEIGDIDMTISARNSEIITYMYSDLAGRNPCRLSIYDPDGTTHRLGGYITAVAQETPAQGLFQYRISFSPASWDSTDRYYHVGYNIGACQWRKGFPLVPDKGYYSPEDTVPIESLEHIIAPYGSIIAGWVAVGNVTGDEYEVSKQDSGYYTFTMGDESVTIIPEMSSEKVMIKFACGTVNMPKNMPDALEVYTKTIYELPELPSDPEDRFKAIKWQDGNAKMYNAGDSVKVTGEMLLTPVWLAKRRLDIGDDDLDYAGKQSGYTDETGKTKVKLPDREDSVKKRYMRWRA